MVAVVLARLTNACAGPRSESSRGQPGRGSPAQPGGPLRSRLLVASAGAHAAALAMAVLLRWAPAPEAGAPPVEVVFEAAPAPVTAPADPGIEVAMPLDRVLLPPAAALAEPAPDAPPPLAPTEPPALAEAIPPPPPTPVTEPPAPTPMPEPVADPHAAPDPVPPRRFEPPPAKPVLRQPAALVVPRAAPATSRPRPAMPTVAPAARTAIPGEYAATSLPATTQAAAAPTPPVGPLLISNPRFRAPPAPPAYPPLAREQGQEGEALIRARLDREGNPDEVVVVSSSGFPMLDRAALAAVRRWAFEPGRRGLEPVVAWIQIPVRFALR